MPNVYSMFSFFAFFAVIAISTALDFHYCFNLLDKYTPNQIERILALTVDGVSKTSPAKEMFGCYLKQIRRGSVKSDIEQYFDIYKKCNEFKANRVTQISELQMTELEKLGLPLYLENYLRENINLINGEYVINYTQNELSKKIELSKQYIEYRTLVLKYRFHNMPGQKPLCCTFVTQISIFLVLVLAKLIS